MKESGRLAVIAIALWFGSGSIADAQPPIRIGATLAQTGFAATDSQGQLRGYQLWAPGRDAEFVYGATLCSGRRASR